MIQIINITTTSISTDFAHEVYAFSDSLRLVLFFSALWSYSYETET